MSRRLRILAGSVLTLGLALVLHAKPRDPDDAAKLHDVTIKNLRFSPDKLSIKAGDTVVWTNKDDNDHTVNADDDSFKSGNLGNGESFKYQFTQKGKFGYSCSYHPRMKGLVLVGD